MPAPNSTGTAAATGNATEHATGNATEHALSTKKQAKENGMTL